MSEQIIRRAGRMVDAQSAMPWLVVASVYVLLIALGPRLLSDPDTYSHIALGRWILEHHTVQPPIRFQPPCEERIGSHSSGCPKPHLRRLMRLEGGPAWSRYRRPRWRQHLVS